MPKNYKGDLHDYNKMQDDRYEVVWLVSFAVLSSTLMIAITFAYEILIEIGIVSMWDSPPIIQFGVVVAVSLVLSYIILMVSSRSSK